MITGQAKDGRRFLIATPTKCGTTTLEELARRHRGGRAGVPLDSFRIMDWESPRRQHRMVPPEGWYGAKRYIMVRNPFDRWLSVYHYLLSPHNYSKSFAKEIQGVMWGGWSMGRVGLKTAPMTFPQFLTFMGKQRERYNAGRWAKRRGEPGEPAWWRSPWIWLEALNAQRNYLDAFPRMLGEAWDLDRTKPLPVLLRLEDIWGGLDEIKAEFDLSSLWLRRSIHANKTLTYPKVSGEDLSSRAQTLYNGFGMCGPEEAGMTCSWSHCWGGVECPSCQFNIDGEYLALGYGDERFPTSGVDSLL